mmetsp:Transcript_7102/g.13600  ORF Transcript_7102/g.13600 Transcript_7102/m.13600 type:complete len:86 (-) Transcript_7102:6-263(-)
MVTTTLNGGDRRSFKEMIYRLLQLMLTILGLSLGGQLKQFAQRGWSTVSDENARSVFIPFFPWSELTWHQFFHLLNSWHYQLERW